MFLFQTDMNECDLANDCDPDAECVNSDGSYTCTCRDGYSGDGKTCESKTTFSHTIYLSIFFIFIYLTNWLDVLITVLNMLHVYTRTLNMTSEAKPGGNTYILIIIKHIRC